MRPWLKAILWGIAALVFVLMLLVVVAFNICPITAWVYTEKYRLTGYPTPDVLLIGSSSIQNWKTSESDLDPLSSVNVGIGGTVVRDWPPLLESLVTPFHPRAVLVYIAANDLHNEHRDPEIVADELTALLADIHTALPDAILYYISVYATGAQPESRADEDALNSAMSALAKETDYMRYVDCAGALLGSDGAIRPALFRDDLVHLNDDGYRIWAQTIRAALSQDFDELND
ncbi:hypothetical protein SDC9_71678 [bioreactor metagenome]|uniref:SGNH hydrolase-type esterase domain-containing protein n=1 Tax=bioreactor metagenome TaxID=1076179 RepID=A0A644YB57_9ZZZZ